MLIYQWQNQSRKNLLWTSSCKHDNNGLHVIIQISLQGKHYVLLLLIDVTEPQHQIESPRQASSTTFNIAVNCVMDRATLDASLDDALGESHTIHARPEVGGAKLLLTEQQFKDLIAVHGAVARRDGVGAGFEGQGEAVMRKGRGSATFLSLAAWGQR